MRKVPFFFGKFNSCHGFKHSPEHESGQPEKDISAHQQKITTGKNRHQVVSAPQPI